MRFVSALVALCVAAVLLAVGIFFKFFTGPHYVATTIPVSSYSEKYLLIDSTVLTSRSGQQMVMVHGTGKITVAYGVTGDVIAWLGNSPYVHASESAGSKTLNVSEVLPSATGTSDMPTSSQVVNDTIVSPAGSDMWTDEVTSRGDANLSLTIHRGESVLVSGDGKSPLPTSVTVAWPRPKPQFLGMSDDLLMIVGGIVLLVGILLYLWGLGHMRGGRGPKRRGRGPRPPLSVRLGLSPRRRTNSELGPGPASNAGQLSLVRAGLVAIGMGAVISAGLTGCSTSPTAQPVSTPSASSSSASSTTTPIVSGSQIDRILGRIVTTVSTADEHNNQQLIATRMGGVALQQRLARYAMRKTNAKIPQLDGLLASPVQLFLPQSTQLWPRSAFVVLKSSVTLKNHDVPSVAAVLTQDSPRSNYKIVSLTNLQSGQQLPEVAASNVGAPLVAMDTALLLVSPDHLAAAYASLLNAGIKSPSYSLFDSTTDDLQPTLLAERKSQKGNADVKVSFKDYANASAPSAFSTSQAGALVTVAIDEVGTFTPTSGLDLKLTGQLAAMTGLQVSANPIKATYTYQLLFYVPPVGATKQVQLLGYTEALTRVKAQA